MAFFIDGQIIVQLTDFIGGWLFKPSCCLLQMVTVWKRSNLPVMFATWIWAVCVNLCGRCERSSCAFNCLSKQMLIIRANVWRLIDALTEANYSFQQGIFTCIMLFTNNVRQSQAFNGVILSQTIQLIQVNETSHDSAEWSCCRKVCAQWRF